MMAFRKFMKRLFALWLLASFIQSIFILCGYALFERGYAGLTAAIRLALRGYFAQKGSIHRAFFLGGRLLELTRILVL
jgi:hypothetical protein